MGAGVEEGAVAGEGKVIGGTVGAQRLVGLAVHFLVFRPLRRAPVLAKVVASVGVLLFIQGVAQVFRCIICMRTGEWIVAAEDVEETEVQLAKEKVTEWRSNSA